MNGRRDSLAATSTPVEAKMHSVDQPKTTPASQDQRARPSGRERWYKNPAYVLGACGAFFIFVLVVAWAVQSLLLTRSHQAAERARVSVQEATIVGPLIQHNVPRATIRFQNSGRSPALTTEIRLVMTVWTSDKLPDWELPPKLTTDAENIGAIDPGAVVSQTLSLMAPLNEEQGVHLERKDWFIVTLGVVSYSDIFGNPHETKLCLIWRNTSSERLSPCEKWNDAD
jgi:hypothetical protein